MKLLEDWGVEDKQFAIVSTTIVTLKSVTKPGYNKLVRKKSRANSRWQECKDLVDYLLNMRRGSSDLALVRPDWWLRVHYICMTMVEGTGEFDSQWSPVYFLQNLVRFPDVRWMSFRENQHRYVFWSLKSIWICPIVNPFTPTCYVSTPKREPLREKSVNSWSV